MKETFGKSRLCRLLAHHGYSAKSLGESICLLNRLLDEKEKERKSKANDNNDNSKINDNTSKNDVIIEAKDDNYHC